MSADTRPTRPAARVPSRGAWPALGLLVLASAVLALEGGPTGLLGAAVVLLAWYRTATIVTVAIAQVVVAAAFPPTVGLVPVVVVEALVLGLLVIPALEGAEPVTTIAGFVAALAGLGCVAWGVLALTGSLVAAVLVLGAVAGAGAYYLHRFGRVVAGRYGDVPT